MKAKIVLAALAMIAVGFTTGAKAGTLADVKARGVLNCLINTGVPAWAYADEKGEWRGFDIDFCRATAAAVLGSPDKVKFVTTTSKTRFTQLAAGEGDLMYRNTTYTMGRDVDLKMEFAAVNYYDGQGFMIRKSANIKSAKQLNGASICIQPGTTTELNLADYTKRYNIKYEPVPIENDAEGEKNYTSGRCDVYTTDASALAAVRSKLEKPADHIILPEIISKEPLGPAVRQGDDEWLNVVRWVYFGLVASEEYGITMANVDQLKASSKDDNVMRILGTKDKFGEQLGLDNDWMVRAIKATGNYGEIFDRYLGPKTPVGLERGLNALYINGGLQYAPPIR